MGWQTYVKGVGSADGDQAGVDAGAGSAEAPVHAPGVAAAPLPPCPPCSLSQACPAVILGNPISCAVDIVAAILDFFASCQGCLHLAHRPHAGVQHMYYGGLVLIEALIIPNRPRAQCTAFWVLQDWEWEWDTGSKSITACGTTHRTLIVSAANMS